MEHGQHFIFCSIGHSDLNSHSKKLNTSNISLTLKEPHKPKYTVSTLSYIHLYSPCSILPSYWSVIIRGIVFKLLYIDVCNNALCFHCPEEERFTVRNIGIYNTETLGTLYCSLFS